MLSRTARVLEAFRSDCRGNIALTFGLLALPIVVTAGAAVDYSMANRTKATLDSFADAAALSVVNTRAMSMTKSQAEKHAKNFFKAQAANLKRGSVDSVKAKVTDTTSGRAAVVSYAASVETSLTGVIGIDAINIHGAATANSALPVYMDFYMLLDNTPSMGVGATPADVSKLVSNTPDKCAFACHQMDAAPNDYYGLAKKLGVTMRIDVVRSATQQLMDAADSSEIVNNQFRVAVYSFGTSATKLDLTNVVPLSSNLSQAKTKAGELDLMTVPYQNYASDTHTNFDKALSDIDDEIATPGDGATQGSPQKILFFVSDGVQDAANVACLKKTVQGEDPKTKVKYTRCQSPLNTQYCTALKKRGIKVAVLYTTYLALPTNSWYMDWIDPFNKGPYGPSPNSEIAENMEACASPGFYFEVSPTQGIGDAMIALFQKASQSARLSK